MPSAEAEQSDERDPFHVLEDEGCEPFLLDERAHLHDRRMAESHAERRLLRESFRELLVPSLPRAGEHFDGDELPRTALGEEHLARASGAELFQDLEPTESRGWLVLGEHGAHGHGPSAWRLKSMRSPGYRE